MKPAFALLFSADGVVLMHRVAQGWVELGRALMADAGFAQSLADLRRMADDLDAGGGVKLVLPGDQILYTKVEALGPGRQKQRSQIKSALIGRTPYQVPDLAFDWVGAGPTVQVAVIARETLAEAEAFALEHGFEPISFVARPDPAEFTVEPFFGITAALPKGTRIHHAQPQMIFPILWGAVHLPSLRPMMPICQHETMVRLKQRRWRPSR